MFPAQIDGLIAVYPEVSNLTSKHNIPLIIAGVCIVVVVRHLTRYALKTKFGKALIDGFKPADEKDQPIKTESESIKKETEKKEK